MPNKGGQYVSSDNLTFSTVEKRQAHEDAIVRKKKGGTPRFTDGRKPQQRFTHQQARQAIADFSQARAATSY